MNIPEMISYLNTLLSDVMKSQLTTTEKKKAVSLIKKIYYWVKENAPQMVADEMHLQELENRMLVLQAEGGLDGGEVQGEMHEEKALQDTGDNILDMINMIEKNLLDTGLDRNTYSSDKMERVVKQSRDQIKNLYKEIDFLKESIEEVKDINMDDINEGDLPSLESEHKKQVADIEKETKALESKKASCQKKEEDIKSLKKELAQLIKGNAAGNKKLAELDVKRRQLHNEVQDLRGNIRVYCRTRRFLPKENKPDPFQPPHIIFIDERTMAVKKEQTGIARAFSKDPNAPGPVVKFKFDYVFGPRTTQAEMFTEIEPLVQSVLDGYNVCCFAYGQTGAGKTYTMSGGEGDQRGMIPRSIEMIFNKINDYIAQGWSYVSKVNIVEIYNDEIRDLLQKFDDKMKFEIKEVDAGEKGEGEGIESMAKDVIVTNLRVVEVHKEKEVYKLLDEAAARRVTANTQCNSESSRSHSVFQLKLEAVDPNKKKFFSVLNLVDLAGSERLDQSGVTGQQKKEAISINKSLTTLGDVIRFKLLAKSRGLFHIEIAH